MRNIKALIIIMCIIITCGCTDLETNKSNEIYGDDQINLTEDVDKQEEIIKYPEIDRIEGYNSIKINFIDSNTEQPLPIELDIESISGLTGNKSYKTIESAVEAEVIKEYNQNYNKSSYTIILKEGYKFRALMNPDNKTNIDGWEDYKSNYPFELTAIEEGNNQVNEFNIKLDYKSSIVSTLIEPEVFK